MEIKVCVGTTCHLLGSSSLVEAINELPEEIKTKITLKYSTCFDKCQQAMRPPVINVDGEFFDDMNPVKMKEMIMQKAGEEG
jgi:NADH:ubiquinone oxidoreductase subunit E